MPDSMRLHADAYVVTVRTVDDVSFLATSLEMGLREHRANGSPLALTPGWERMVTDLRAFLATLGLPPAEVAAEVSTDPTSDARPWLTTQETASHLGAAGVRGGDRRVRQLLQAGRLDGRPEGRRWLVDPDSLDRYIAERIAA